MKGGCVDVQGEMVEEDPNELPPEFVPSENDVICGWARQNYHHGKFCCFSKSSCLHFLELTTVVFRFKFQLAIGCCAI